MNVRFDPYYSEIYLDRWKALKASLLTPAKKTTHSCFQGFAEYYMDEASIIAARALGAKPGEQVLDMCAAPGGKTLVVFETMKGQGELIANELSSDRRRRLREVLDKHVPEEFRSRVQVTGFDGNQFGLKRAGYFDRVLLDAPCSSERHMLEDDAEQRDWKPSRTEQLAKRQYSLICSAMLSLKAGGSLVYSTCSISPQENDGVVGRLLDRHGDKIELDSKTDDLSNYEKTMFGFQIFPDRFKGAGPIFISRLIRKA